MEKEQLRHYFKCLKVLDLKDLRKACAALVWKH